MPSKVQTAPESPGLINQRCEKCGALRHVEPYRQDGNPDGILLCYFCSPDSEIDRMEAQEARMKTIPLSRGRCVEIFGETVYYGVRGLMNRLDSLTFDEQEKVVRETRKALRAQKAIALYGLGEGVRP